MKIILSALLVFIFIKSSYGQGCVAVRSMSCVMPLGNNTQMVKQEHGHWQISTAYRYFKSFRHFVGDKQQYERVENNTQVVNYANIVDIGINYTPDQRLSFGLNLPYQHFDRSSLYEHYGNSITANPQQLRFYTGASGIGDLRLNANYWMIDPMKGKSFNYAFGLGVKLPTGNFNAKDKFHKLNAEKLDYTIEKPVDQSIQLGDGGFGINIESQAYFQISHKIMLFANGYYMMNPKETNGVIRNPESTTTDPLIKEFSIADQYAARIASTYNLSHRFSLIAAARIEGVPSSDLIGGDKGFRRPGYIISGEPGLMYMDNKISMILSLPISLYRNRTKSFFDKQDPKGIRHGDAAFADYLINVSVAYRF